MRFVPILLLASAASGATVSDLIRTVREALAQRRPDAAIAVIVLQSKLTEHLEDPVIEELQSEGAGPQTVEELEQQRDRTVKLPRAAAVKLFDAPPSPSAEEQAGVLEKARAIALQYTAGLPDFLCTETVRRFVEPKGKTWNPRDVLTVDVGFSEKGERYKLLAVDGAPTNKTLNQVGGFKSNGEFGSLLKAIFRPESTAVFHWQRWTRLNGRLSHVYSYAIDRAHSSYTVATTSLLKRNRVTTGMLGFVFIDGETSQVMRFSDGDDGLPPNWPILQTESVLDYDYAEVGGRKFLLPRRVDLRLRTKQGRARNVMEFGNYRKFSGEATLSFEK